MRRRKLFSHVHSICLIILTAVIAFTAISCSVGLGDAVDTQVPNLSIETPPVDAVIRDKFAIGGVWNDDSEVSSVKISLKRTDSNMRSSSQYSFNGDVKTSSSGKGSWSVLIDPLKNDLRINDGKYEIEAVAYDPAGHSTRVTRLITIDNTAPVIVLDRPASKDGETSTLDAYGQKLSVLGRAADDNDVDIFVMKFLGEPDAQGESTSHIVVKDNVSNTIDETVAIWKDDDSLNNSDYKKIYGQDKNAGNKNYTCNILAFDKARKYPETYPFNEKADGSFNIKDVSPDQLDPASPDKNIMALLGNAVNHYFLFSDLADNLLDKYSVTDLYKMKSNNYEKEDRASFNGKNPLEELEKKIVKTGKFSLNPKNNPTYTIAGSSAISSFEDFDNSLLTNGDQIQIDIYPGADGYAIRKPFEENYVIKVFPCKENKDSLGGQGSSVGQGNPGGQGSSGNNSIIESAGKIIDSKKLKITYPGNGCKVSFNMEKDMLGDFGPFLLKIEGVGTDKPGTDKKGNDLIIKYEENGVEKSDGNLFFGFKLTPGGMPPALEINDISNQYFNDKNNSVIKFKGNVKVKEGEPSLKLKIFEEQSELTLNKQDSEGNYLPVPQPKLVQDKEDNNQYNFEYEINLNDLNLGSEKATSKKSVYFLAGASLSNGNTERQMRLNYDILSPAGVPKIVNKDDNSEIIITENTWFNESQISVEVSGVADDVNGASSGINGIVVSIDGGRAVPLLPNEDKTDFTGDIDIPNGHHTLNFKITDNVGNEKNIPVNNVRVDTVAPEAVLVSIDSEYVNPDIELGQKRFENPKLVNGDNNVNVTFNLKDKTSGLSSIKLKSICGVAVNLSKEIKGGNTSSASGNISSTGDFIFEIPKDVLPKTTKSGAVEFEITDKAGNISLISPFNMTIDKDLPEIKINDIIDADSDDNENDIDVNGLITLKGSVSDIHGLDGDSVTLEYKEGSAAGAVGAPGAGSSGWVPYKEKLGSDFVWSVDIDTTKLKSRDYSFRLKAADKAGNVAYSDVLTLNVNQDSDRPVIEFKNLGKKDGQSNKYTLTTNTLYVVVNDDDGTISKNNIHYQILDNIPSTEPVSNWITPEDYNGGSFSIELEDGPNNIILFKITDQAGTAFHSVKTSPDSDKECNKVRIKNNIDSYLTLKVDTTAPVFGKLQYSENGFKWEDLSSFAQKAYGGNKNKFYFKQYAYDANGVTSLTVTLDEKHGDKGNSKYVYNFTNDTSDSLILDGLSYSAWKSDEINVAGLASGIRMATFTVSDGAKNNKSQVMVNIDNTAPKLSGPDSHENGANIRSSFLLKGGTDDENCEILYVLTGSEKLPEGFNWDNNPMVKKYKDGPKSSWRIYFDGNINENQNAPSPDGFTHDLDQKEYFGKIYKDLVDVIDGVVYKKGSKTDKFTEKKPFYFHFKLTDRLGNSSVSSGFHLIVDPQGDIPVIKLTSPDPASANTVSGIIRLQGFAEDDHTIAGLYMQIDPSYDPHSGFNPWTEDNRQGLDLGYKTELINSKVEGAKKKPTDVKGIFVGDSTSWNFSINKDGKLNGKDGANNTIALRFYATDIDGNMSTPTEDEVYVFTIDSSNPKIGSSEPIYLYQFKWLESGTGKAYYTNTGTPTSGDILYNEVECINSSGKTWNRTSYTKDFASMEYKPDMWVKGLWWLSCSVEDESGIKNIDFGTREDVLSNQIWHTQKDKKWPTTSGGSGTSGYVINLLVGSKDTGSKPYGKLNYSLTAYDNDGGIEASGKDTTANFVINYDNKAPTLEKSGDNFFHISDNVVNNNGFYTLSSAAYEESGESGFDKVVFYFERPAAAAKGGSGNSTIYDSYMKKKSAGSELSSSNLIKKYGLYWKKNSISTINGNVVEVSREDSNIHTGGLVSIAGSVYVITEKSGNRLTLDGIPASDLKGAEIYTAVGHVVDHRGIESNGKSLSVSDDYYGYYSDLQDDDKDRMVEKVVSSGTRTEWEGNINSNNIPDGPIDIHYVVFDNAGNYKEDVIKGNVKNNAPRLASIRVWTDYNTDGVVQEESETEGYYLSGKTRQIGGKSVYKATSTADKLLISGENNSAFMTVKDEFNFIPEIVGGNGQLYYSYEITNTNNSVSKNGSEFNISFVNGKDDNIDQTADKTGYYLSDDEGSGYIKGNTDGKIPVSAELLQGLGNSSLSKPTIFNYKIWDSTEGTKPGRDSLHADFSINLNVQYADTEAPTVTINKFGWENNNNNSLYHNSRKNGHIELEEDLTQEIINILGNDPKVSGKITIKGTAKDNIRIKELKVVFPGIVGSDADTGKNHVLAATYNKGNWVSQSPDNSENMKKNHWTFKAEDISADKNGHEVAWEFNVDTEALSTVAQKDITVKVFAVGERDKKESAETPKSRYKMDVVPYITGVKTKLSNKDTSTAVYSRTALGHYPVMSGETEVKLLGFNLGSNTSVDMSSRTSGSFSVSVNGIETLNNINKKDAGKKTTADSNSQTADSNSQTADISSYDYNINMYNRQPNRENNNLLTDDVIFDVWDINNNAALPIRGNISEPVMKINPDNGIIGFAFVSGPADFSMAQSDNSYKNWHRNYATFTNVSFTYDKNGNSHGTCTGLDTYPDGDTTTQGGRFSYVTSKWGPALSLGSENNYNGDNAIRLEAIGVQGANEIIVGGQVNPGYIIDEHRFGSPSIVATVDGSTTAVYLAYYDAIQKQIRFRVNNSVGDIKTSNGDFLDNLNCSTGDNKHKYIKEAGTDKFSLIAGKDYQKDSNGNKITINTKDNGRWSDPRYTYEPSSTDFYDTGYNASPFVAIDAIPKGTILNGESTGTTADIVVAVWYDGKDCYYSSIKGPGANGDDMGGTPNKDADKDGYWATPKKIFTGAGEYCTVKTDGKGGIHIAAYDISGADVKYAYIPKYNSTYDEQTDAVTVDSYAITGTNISIDVGKKTADGSYIPYISYYMPSIQGVRMAYLVAEKNGKADYKAAGTNDKDEFTGNWEVTTIPSESRIKEDHVSIGLWKDYDSGLIKKSTKNPGIGNSASGNTGTCYGNGTANPVIGYAISKTTSGAIETAQMK